MRKLFIFAFITLSQLCHSALQLTDNEAAFKTAITKIIKQLPIRSSNKQKIYTKSYECAQKLGIEVSTLINTLIEYAAINTQSNLKTCCTVCQITLTEEEICLYKQKLHELSLSDLDLIHSVGKNDVARVEQLLKAGARINAQVPYGYATTSPLQLAAFKGYNDIIRLFLAHPLVDVNIQDAQKLTPLMIALTAGHPRIAQLLVNHPAINPNLTNKAGKNAAFIAIKKGYCVIG